MANFIATLRDEDLLELRALIIADTTALGKWAQVTDTIVTTTADRTRIKRLLRSTEAGEIEEAVLLSIQLMRSAARDDNEGTDFLDVLRAHKLNYLAAEIENVQFGDVTSSKRRGIWFDVGEVVHTFTGRRAELGQLHALFTECHAADSVNTVCIGGLGGVGKSMLARRYAYEKSEFYNGNVIWINAESYDSMSGSFLRLAERLGVRVRRSQMQGVPFGLGLGQSSVDEDEEFIRRIYAKLSGKKCLLVFDNVSDKPNPDLDKFKPKVTNPVDAQLHYLLMTSRRSDLAPRTRYQLNLDVLREEEAVQLITGDLPGSSPTQAAILAQKLQALPLALQQALAYIRNTYLDAPDGENCIPKYLKELDASAERLLADNSFQENDIYAFTVLTTWDITMKRIQKLNVDGSVSPSPVELMNHLSYLSPERISVKFLDKLLEASTEASLNLLKKYSMISAQGQHVSVHRLVQQVVRIRLVSEKVEGDLVSKVCQCLDKVMDEHGYMLGRIPEEIRESAAHGIFLFPFQVKHEFLCRDVLYLHKLCLRLEGCRNRNVSAAFSIAKQSADVLLASHGQAYPGTVMLQLMYAHSLLGTPLTPEAVNEALKVLESALTVVNDPDFDTQLRHKLALDIYFAQISMYMYRGNYTKAFELCEQFERASTSSDEGSQRKNLSYLVVTGYKAVALAGVGRPREALHLALVYENYCRQRFGPTNLVTLAAKLYVGQVALMDHNLIVALAHFSDAYNGHKELFGDEDLAVVKMRELLAMVEELTSSQMGRSVVILAWSILLLHKPPSSRGQIIHGLSVLGLTWLIKHLWHKVEEVKSTLKQPGV